MEWNSVITSSKLLIFSCPFSPLCCWAIHWAFYFSARISISKVLTWFFIFYVSRQRLSNSLLGFFFFLFSSYSSVCNYSLRHFSHFSQSCFKIHVKYMSDSLFNAGIYWVPFSYNLRLPSSWNWVLFIWNLDTFYVMLWDFETYLNLWTGFFWPCSNRRRKDTITQYSQVGRPGSPLSLPGMGRVRSQVFLLRCPFPFTLARHRIHWGALLSVSILASSVSNLRYMQQK